MIIKKYKEILISLILIAIVVCFYIIKYITLNNETKDTKSNNLSIEEINEDTTLVNDNTYNEEELKQSMQKGDRFAKFENIIIYANDYDESIYMLNLKDKNIKKIYKAENGIDKIYFDGEFIYILPYYYRGKGITRIDLQGNSSKIYEGSSIQLWLQGEEIYFVEQIGYDKINGTPQGNLSVMNKDGSNKKVLIENVKNYFYIVNDNIYYVDQTSRSIYSSKIDGTERKEIAKGRNYITSVNDKCLTYLDYNDGEKQHIIFLDNNKNIKVGRFGNVYNSSNNTYIYTRNLIGENNEIENEYTLYKVDYSNYTLSNLLKNDTSMEFLTYVFNDYAYFRSGSKIHRISLKNKNSEELNMGYSYFTNGKSYCIKSKEGVLTELDIFSLEDMNKIEIKF